MKILDNLMQIEKQTKVFSFIKPNPETRLIFKNIVWSAFVLEEF